MANEFPLTDGEDEYVLYVMRFRSSWLSDTPGEWLSSIAGPYPAAAPLMARVLEPVYSALEPFDAHSDQEHATALREFIQALREQQWSRRAD